MGSLVAILTLFLLLVLYVRNRSTEQKLQQLSERLQFLEDELRRLRQLSKTKVPESNSSSEEAVRSVTPPPIPAEMLRPRSHPPDSKHTIPSINWEQFMGVNLFAWFGGFALFLAAVFFVKYSIDRNLITPQIRIIIGSILGIFLITLGLRVQRIAFAVSAQTLCATGTVILYTVIFAAYSFYQFIGFASAFVLMNIVTIIAFVLAAHLNARFVAVLGLLGGFLTPVIISRDQTIPRMSAYLTDSAAAIALVLVSGYAILHKAITIMLRHFQANGAETPLTEVSLQFSTYVPYILLSLAIVTVPLRDPSTVFAAALLLTIMVFSLGRLTLFIWLLPFTFAGALFLLYGLEIFRFHASNPQITLPWYVIFCAAFSIYPFLLHREFETKMLPWRIAALSGPAHFYLIYTAVSVLYGTSYIGLLPLTFSILPLAGFLHRMRTVPFDSPLRNANLAWFAGAFLFFITLIFPVQFDREWITIGWAMQGVALLLLFHKIPHPGLRLLGVALLVVSFFRLTVNPDVLTYHARSSVRIFNWYFYTYGNVIAALVIGAKLLKPPREKIRNADVQTLLYALAVILAFVLLNIEIADYFATGSVLTFEFSGSFARDMSYSIAWAVYALILLIIGIRKKITSARYASIALLSITLMKLFFHDLASLNQLYRVGALVGVALMLILASYLYQRFVSFETKET